MTTAFNDSYLQRKFSKGHIHGFGATYATTTTLTIPAGECRDSTDAVNMVLPTATTLNSALLGLNGIDTGTVAVNAWYGIWLVSDSSNNPLNPTGVVMSLSFTTPVLSNITSVMPSSYDTYRLIDYVLTDGSGNFIKGYTTGNGTIKTRYWDAIIATAVTAGAAQTLTPINCEVGIPVATGIVVNLEVQFTPNAANDYVGLAHGGSTATLLPTLVGDVAAKIASKAFKLIPLISTTHNQVQYINSAASGATAAWINGFDFSL